MPKNSNPVLSFIIPVYNSEKTLEECVNSIICQAKDGFEIILVDDGSGSVCAELCDKIADDYSYTVKVIHKQNGGSLTARIEGAKHAEGEYVLYVDADDLLLYGAVEHILNDISDGADMYIYDYYMDSVGGDEKKDIKIFESNDIISYDGQNKVLVSHTFMRGMMNTVCATAIKKELLLKTIFDLPTQKIKHGEDRLQKMFLIINADRIVYVPYAFYHYRWFDNSQGNSLRVGSFSLEIYNNFKITWGIERKNYLNLGFNIDEAKKYDVKKLNRICSLLERSYAENISRSELKNMISFIAKDELFLDLCNKDILSMCRSHIKREINLIKSNKISLLFMYWSFCKFVRSIVHLGK